MPDGVTLDVLGTGSATSVDRRPTCFAVGCGHSVVLVDTGGGPQLRSELAAAGVDESAVATVAVTHADFDHSGGLPALLYARALEPEVAPLAVVATPAVIRRLRALVAAVAESVLDGRHVAWRAVPPGQAVEPCSGVRLAAFAARHGRPREEAAGFVLEHAGVRLCFSGDTAPSPVIERHARACSLLVHEASLPDGDAELAHRLGHSTPGDAGRCAARAGARALMLVHLNTAPGEAAETELIAMASASFGGPIVVPSERSRFAVTVSACTLLGGSAREW